MTISPSSRIKGNPSARSVPEKPSHRIFGEGHGLLRQIESLDLPARLPEPIHIGTEID